MREADWAVMLRMAERRMGCSLVPAYRITKLLAVSAAMSPVRDSPSVSCSVHAR